MRQSGRLFEAVFANATDAIVLFNDERLLTDVNPAAEEMLGVTRTAALEMFIDDFSLGLMPSDSAAFWPSFTETDGVRGEMQVTRPDGAPTRVEYTINAAFLPGRNLMVMRDISSRYEAELKVKRHMAQQTAIAELSTQALRSRDLDQLFDSAAESVARVLDAEVVAVLELERGEDLFAFRAGIGLGGLSKGHQVPFLPTTSSQFSFTMDRDEVVLVDDFEKETRFDPLGKLSRGFIRSGISVRIPGLPEGFGVLGGASSLPGAFNADDGAFLTAAANVLADAIERNQNERDLENLAHHDPLTGLGNRTLFLSRLTEALAGVTDTGPQLAVVSLDLDDFKSMNDTFGHRAGDQLLVEVGARIRTTVREGDTVARFGGDEFVVLYLDVLGDDEVATLADRLLESLDEPFTFGDEQCSTKASLGIAVSDDGNLDGERLLHDADIALYQSKEKGRAMWTVANPEMRAGVIERSDTKLGLEQALGTDQLYLDYQPIIDLRTGELCGVEALARWNHPTRGAIPPDTFIPIAETSGLILKVGEWVLREACEQAVAWREECGAGSVHSVNINVSTRQVAQMDLGSLLKNVLEQTGAKASEISLEITESVLIDNFGGPRETLAEVRDMGVRIVLDDFGTGYSSLSYLDQFHIDTLKIDRSFVSSLGTSDAPAPVVTAIIGMARALNIQTVAEGVETIDQAVEVTTMGCKYAQGYLYSPPTSANAISRLLQQDAPFRELVVQAEEIASSGVTGS